MPTPRRRATAARQAYRRTNSPGGQYSLRGLVKDAYGAPAARAVGRSLASSARQPGKGRTFVDYGGRQAVVMPRRSDIDYSKMARTLSTHVSMGEIKGAVRNVERTYRRNLRRSG
jgi:hypothetical protein